LVLKCTVARPQFLAAAARKLPTQRLAVELLWLQWCNLLHATILRAAWRLPGTPTDLRFCFGVTFLRLPTTRFQRTSTSSDIHHRDVRSLARSVQQMMWKRFGPIESKAEEPYVAVRSNDGLAFSGGEVQVSISVASDEAVEVVRGAAAEAERSCPISKSLGCPVTVAVDIHVPKEEANANL
jgi:hypothetical protein